MSYESKVHELRVKSLWVMNQKSMSYDFYWFQSNFNKKTLPQCLFCLSLYMFLYKRCTESPVYITPNISWTIFSQFPHAFPKINNRLQTNQWQISDRYCKHKQICYIPTHQPFTQNNDRMTNYFTKKKFFTRQNLTRLASPFTSIHSKTNFANSHFNKFFQHIFNNIMFCL